VAVIVVTVILTLWPRQRITAANFSKSQIGMSQAELRGLLGDPEFDSVLFGLVEGPKTFITKFDFSNEQEQLRQRGFQDYRFQQWTSSEISIVVVSDQEGQVVCRYSSEGRPWEWRRFLRRFIFW
jgi:hypothetical protein